MSIPTLPNYCFIDGQNLESYFYSQNQKIDPKLLFTILTQNFKNKQCFYFVKGQNPNSAYIKNLKSIGYKVIYGNAKSKTTDSRISFNIDSELIVNTMTKFFETEKFNFFLLSGDGDYQPLIKFFEQRNHGVKIISPSRNCTSTYLINNKQTKRNRDIIYLDSPELLPKIMTPTEAGVEGTV
jgi:uncharacterized LabA/DUF88 family protein